MNCTGLPIKKLKLWRVNNMKETNKLKGNSEIILYQTEDGTSKIEVRFDNETV
jgi:hypothetical protein